MTHQSPQGTSSAHVPWWG